MMSRGPYPMLLMLAMSLPGAARAVGLGDIRVESALNEPLSAQIDILGATREELLALTAKVANRDLFVRYGDDRPAFLNSATFKVGTDAQGRPVLNVRSAEAFTDPVVNLVVDLRWGTGELVREYSLLLDPPGFGTSAGAAPQRASDSASPTVHTAAPPRPAPSSSVDGTHYPVAAGDTLMSIVRRTGATTHAEQQRMMIAIFRANPHAFAGNINVLQRGVVLAMPAPEAVKGIDPAEAGREIQLQTTAWRTTGKPSRSGTPELARMPRAAALAAVATSDARPDADLKSRVSSLEQTLDAMTQQLARGDAEIAA
ncbi:MAG: hypothetical protein M3O06_05035, partial [Pseudomonadota bacterium]|nr:hypothetical protein [Pseudomonadota bacterium]